MKKLEFEKFKNLSLEENQIRSTSGGAGWWPYKLTVTAEEFETGLDGSDRPLSDDELTDIDARWG